MALTAVLAALGVVVVLVLAYVIGSRAARSSTAAADERMAVALEQQAAALAQQAAHLEARLGMEREHTVTAAADMAAKLAGEKLGDTMAGGTRAARPAHHRVREARRGSRARSSSGWATSSRSCTATGPSSTASSSRG